MVEFRRYMKLYFVNFIIQSLYVGSVIVMDFTFVLNRPIYNPDLKLRRSLSLTMHLEKSRTAHVCTCTSLSGPTTEVLWENDTLQIGIRYT